MELFTTKYENRKKRREVEKSKSLSSAVIKRDEYEQVEKRFSCF